MVVIITDVRYRMSLALIRSLGQAGAEVVTCEGERCKGNAASPALGALSRYASRHVWLPEGPGYLDALADLCRETGEAQGCRPALLPVGAGTLGLLAGNRERFEGLCGLCIPTAKQLDLFNDKARVSALAEALGVPVPGRYVRREGEDLDAFFSRAPLPCVVKPVCGEKLGLTAAQRYVAAEGQKRAKAAFSHFSRLAGEDPVVQEYLPGGALGCSVLAREGQVMASICHRRLREYPVLGGPSSCCQCVERPDLVSWAEKMVRETGYTGLAMFEFKEDAAGKPRLLEVNPRVWGTFPLTRAAGSVIPLLWCVLAWNEGNPERREPLPVPGPLPGRKMIFAASDLMAGTGYARRGRPGELLRALGDFFNPAVRDGLFEWGDILPGLAYYRSLLAKERHS